MKELHDLRGMLCDELKEYAKKGELSAGSLSTIDTLAHALKNIDKVIEDDDGYNDSYARGRSRMTGRYISRDDYANRGYSSRYSRDGDKREHFAMQLEELMEKAPDEKTRNQLRKTISDVNNNMEV